MAERKEWNVRTQVMGEAPFLEAGRQTRSGGKPVRPNTVSLQIAQDRRLGNQACPLGKHNNEEGSKCEGHGLLNLGRGEKQKTQDDCDLRQDGLRHDKSSPNDPRLLDTKEHQR